ncbi:hypothetical protein O3Q51_09300 [Cryomorphaceae bacterium 1068]|nr:hypothetical protein [Cryomorphaceae bacterium 1068]
MKQALKFFLFLISLSTCLNGTAQEREISVLLYPSYVRGGFPDDPSSLQVCFLRTAECVPVSKEGFFRIKLPTHRDTVTLYVSSIYRGVVPIEVSTHTDSIQFVRNDRYSIRNWIYPYSYPNSPTVQSSFDWGVDGSIGVDLSNYSLTGFENLLTPDEFGMMTDSVTSLFLFDINIRYKRLEMAIGWGFADRFEDKESIRYDARRRRYDLRLGYRLIDKDYFFFTGYGSIRWARWRILSGYDNKVDDETFNERRDTDIRINQFFWETGIRSGLILRFKDSDLAIQAGFSLGYLFRMHDSPGVASDISRIDNNAKVTAQDPSFGIFFSLVVP